MLIVRGSLLRKEVNTNQLLTINNEQFTNSRRLRFNKCMSNKTEKELAFLRDLTIDGFWTERFTEIFDENFDFAGGEEKILYVNAGTGNHALALREKLDENAEISGVSENEELAIIANAKAKAVKAETYFSHSLPDEKFKTVLADASFVRPSKLEEFLSKIVDLSKKQTVFFLPTAGSFGEIFSVLWETLLDLDLVEKGAEVERLIVEIPTVSRIEEMAEKAGLKKLQTTTKTELFDFENGKEFVESTLVEDFLMPVWLDFLSETEKEQVKERLAQLIDEDRDEISFLFSVKITLISGKVN